MAATVSRQLTGLRLQGQKSEISDEDEDDSSSTKTTLFIDIDEEFSELAAAKGGNSIFEAKLQKCCVVDRVKSSRAEPSLQV